MITITFYAPTRQGRLIQDLVKRYDGRFVYNPFPMFNNESKFDISFEDGYNYKMFSICQQITEQPFY